MRSKIYKIWHNIKRNKFKTFWIFIMWLLFGFSIVAILNKIGLISCFLGASIYAEGINEVIHNLSYSYMAGLVFYMINDWVPRKVREKKARQLLSNEIDELKTSLNNINRLFVFLETNDKIKPSDTYFKGDVWIKTTNNNVEKINKEQYLAVNTSKSQELLKKITASPVFGDMNKSFANTIVSLKSNQLLNSSINNGYKIDKIDDFKILFSQLEDYLFIPTDELFYTCPTQHECLQAEANNIVKS